MAQLRVGATVKTGKVHVRVLSGQAGTVVRKAYGADEWLVQLGDPSQPTLPGENAHWFASKELAVTA